MELYHFIIALD